MKLKPPQRPPVQNSFDQKVAALRNEGGLTGQVLYENMRKVNQLITTMRMQLEGLERPGGFTSFQGRLNGEPVLIDGFDGIHRMAVAQTGDSPANAIKG